VSLIRFAHINLWSQRSGNQLRSGDQSEAQGEALRALGYCQLFVENREAATENEGRAAYT